MSFWLCCPEMSYNSRELTKATDFVMSADNDK